MECLGCISACLMHEHELSSRVVSSPLADIIGFALDHDPQIVSRTVLVELLPRYNVVVRAGLTVHNRCRQVSLINEVRTTRKFKFGKPYRQASEGESDSGTSHNSRVFIEY